VKKNKMAKKQDNKEKKKLKSQCLEMNLKEKIKFEVIGKA